MLRTTLLVTIALAASIAVVPSANASHMGPCWHEYAEAALDYALNHHSAKELGSDVGGCVDGTVWWVCYGYPWISCVLS